MARRQSFDSAERDLGLDARITRRDFLDASLLAAGSVLLTAVLSDGNTVHLVNAGQTIAGYKIVTVTEDSVTLADAAGQQTILRLR